MESSISASKLTPKHEQLVIRDIVMVVESQSKEGDSFFLITHRAELALVVLHLNKAETRDKICRAIQYGSKFLSNGEAGTAQNVDKSTSLARKVFRLFKYVNDLYALISPTPQGTPLPIILLGK